MAFRLILLGVVLTTALGLQTGSAAAAAPPTQWCGRDVVTTDRPDSLTGAQIHVIYATPSDGEDRFGALVSAITTDLAWIDAWWRREDPLRAPRFDLFPFAACPGGVAAMDISGIRLAQPSAYYAPFATRFGRLATDLAGSPYGHAHPGKKYLVYYDGALDTSTACGQGQSSARLGGFVGYAMVFVRCPFGPVLGTGSSGAIIAVHELVHAFGAVPRETPGPPHPCSGDIGHICDSSQDIVSPGALAATVDGLLLDVGRDDYYAHGGSWWDVQDSIWLQRLDRARVALSVAITGGPGTVESDLPGVACSAPCATDWEQGTILTLMPTPADGAAFRGWSGACSGTGDCTLTLDAATSVTARFALPATVRIKVSGGGTVSSRPAGIICGTTCTTDFDRGTRVVLAARPARGKRLVAWSGACKGKAPTCAFVLDGPKAASARFAAIVPKR